MLKDLQVRGSIHYNYHVLAVRELGEACTQTHSKNAFQDPYMKIIPFIGIKVNRTCF